MKHCQLEHHTWQLENQKELYNFFFKHNMSNCFKLATAHFHWTALSRRGAYMFHILWQSCQNHQAMEVNISKWTLGQSRVYSSFWGGRFEFSLTPAIAAAAAAGRCTRKAELRIAATAALSANRFSTGLTQPLLCKLISARTAFKLMVTNQSVTNIFKYSIIQIFSIQIFIRVFVRIIFWIRIYSDIRSC